MLGQVIKPKTKFKLTEFTDYRVPQACELSQELEQVL